MMKKADAFLTIPRRDAAKESVEERLTHYGEITKPLSADQISEQAARCMGCGVPFCHGVGCPLGNVIPECNALVAEGRWREASDMLHLSNNFPEFTGRVCPALCEASCVNALGGEAVTIRQIELAVTERAFAEGWVRPMPPDEETGKRVAVVGSGPAGLAAAQQLRRAGHAVTVFDRAERPGGILRWGIPDFKLDRSVLDRRIAQLIEEGVRFELNVEAGVDISSAYLRKKFDAVCLCGGAMVPRDLVIPGRDARGIHFAVPFLVQQNRRVAGMHVSDAEPLLATDLDVIIIGGGDTGNDCLGTALRQGAKSVVQLELLPRPPAERDPATPWPTWPFVLRRSTSHEEGGRRDWSVSTTAFKVRGAAPERGDPGRVCALECERVTWEKDPQTGRMEMTPVPGSGFEIKADLVLLAMGFVQPAHEGLLDGLGVKYDGRGNVKVDERMMTGVEGVFAAGDMNTGAWLVVGAIAGGRRMARQVDLYLMGETSLPDCLPAPTL